VTRQSGITAVLLLIGFGLASIHAEAQQLEKIPRLGFLQRRVAPTYGNPDPLGNAFRQGLRDLGYIDGKNIVLEQRYAEGMEERLPALVAELIELKVDIIVVPGFAAIRAAKQATKSVPVVMIATGDPVAAGLIHSLARPGGNITGVTRLTGDLRGKRLEVLQETVPGMSRVGVLGGSSTTNSFQDYEAAARVQKITVQLLELRGPQFDFKGTLEAVKNTRLNALVTIRDGLTASYAKQIADLAIKTRLASMHEDSAYVEVGGLMSYATNDADQFRRAAIYVDKILKGAKPAELPVEQPTSFELTINVKTAKQIGLTIPPNVLARADKVIR
jgi:putative tryptophan/tyrosine transport system substrate-binding protein